LPLHSTGTIPNLNLPHFLLFPLEPVALSVARYATPLFFCGFPDNFQENTPSTV